MAMAQCLPHPAPYCAKEFIKSSQSEVLVLKGLFRHARLRKLGNQLEPNMVTFSGTFTNGVPGGVMVTTTRKFHRKCKYSSPSHF